MTMKAKEDTLTATKSDAPTRSGEVAKAAAAAVEEKPAGVCVVDDGTPHMGRATPGAVICSAHAVRYHADGRKRGS